MNARTDGARIRIASMSLRMRCVLEVALADLGYSGILAFTFPEALLLAGHGFRHTLVAYPSACRAALSTLLGSEARDHVTVPVDARVRVYLDINVSWVPARSRPDARASHIALGPLRSPISVV